MNSDERQVATCMRTGLFGKKKKNTFSFASMATDVTHIVCAASYYTVTWTSVCFAQYVCHHGKAAAWKSRANGAQAPKPDPGSGSVHLWRHS